MDGQVRFEAKDRKLLRGQEVNYRIAWAEYPAVDAAAQTVGTIFAYEYLRTDTACLQNRPVAFAYNGGPGASCFWLHMGCLSPRRVKTQWLFECDSHEPAELLEDNPECPLDVCDIVLLDPVATGYGQLFKKDADPEIFNMETDAAITANFIVEWLHLHDRWDSPVYLIGESYGTMRSALVATCLSGGPVSPAHKGWGVRLSGLILMGNSLISRPTNGFFSEKGLPMSVQILPTIAAVNWYYEPAKDDSLQERVKAAEQFICKDYLSALYLGNRLPENARVKIAAELSALTGISPEKLLASDLQLDSELYSRLRLGDAGQIMSGYDARFIRRNSESADPIADDAALATLTPLFVKAFRAYEKELGVRIDRQFVPTDYYQAVNWIFRSEKTPFVHLQAAISRDRNMKVFFANGLYDFRSETGQAAYAAAQLKAEPGQLFVNDYPAGHMPYVGTESAHLFGTDLRNFISKGTTDV